MDTFTTCLLIAVAGAAGTLARYGLSIWMMPVSHQFPFATLLINVLGSFIIGFFGTLTLAHGKFPTSENVRLFVMVGLCGGFTTFSAFSLQTLDLMRSGAMVRALMNIALSIVLCIGAVAIGHIIAARLNGGAVQIVQIEIEEQA